MTGPVVKSQACNTWDEAAQGKVLLKGPKLGSGQQVKLPHAGRCKLELPAVCPGWGMPIILKPQQCPGGHWTRETAEKGIFPAGPGAHQKPHRLESARQPNSSLNLAEPEGGPG